RTTRRGATRRTTPCLVSGRAICSCSATRADRAGRRVSSAPVPNPTVAGHRPRPHGPKTPCGASSTDWPRATRRQASSPRTARRTYGGVAGVSMNVASNATVGISVDQSKTRIDITAFPQHATLDLTQVGINGAYEWGKWTFSGAAVYGFGHVDQSRETFFFGP